MFYESKKLEKDELPTLFEGKNTIAEVSGYSGGSVITSTLCP